MKLALFIWISCLWFAAGASAEDLALVQQGKPMARIVVANHMTEVERFAVEELQRYVAAMTTGEWAHAGVMLPMATEAAQDAAPPCEILVGRATTHARLAKLCADHHIAADDQTLASDGYVIKSIAMDDGRRLIVLTAASERGVLFATYQFLEVLGVRFFGYRDRDGEIVPHRDTLTVPSLDVTERPAFRYRCVSDNNFSAADQPKLANIADWAAKNRCNVFMLTPSRAGETWGQIALDEVRRRGLVIAGPGHVLAQFTPDRSLLAAHPDYFPLLKGRRTANYSEAWGGVPSFCWSNEAAMELVTANAMRYLEAAPFIDIFAVYPPDGSLRGSQCQCEQCAKRSVSDWYLTLMNRIARECAMKYPTKKVMWIAYNECGVPPAQAQPWDHGRNMVLLWCNDVRDFRAPMDSEINRHAASYLALKPRLITIKTDGKGNPGDTDLAPWHRWQNWRAFLQGAGFTGDVILLDYYNAHVGNSLHVPMLRHCQSGPWPDGLMQHDFQTYRAQGIAGWQNCTDYYNDSPTPYWNRLSAQLLWNPQINVAALDADFCAQWFGPAGEVMQRYSRDLWHELSLDHSGEERALALTRLGEELAEAEALAAKSADDATAKHLRAAREFHRRLAQSATF